MARRMRLAPDPARPGGGALPFVLWSLLPVGSSADPSPGQIQKQDRPQQLADRRPQGPRAGADDRHLQPDAAASTTLQSDITRLSDAPAAAADEPRRASARELAAVQRRLRQERARLTRLRARLLVVRRALASRLVELYKADAPDVDHGRARVRGLRRPADAHRVHGARLAPGRARSWTSSPTPRRTRPRPPSGSTRSRSARRGSPREIESQRDEVSIVRVGLVDRRDRIQTARSNKIALLAQLARPPPRARGRRREPARGAGEDPGQAGRLLRPGHRGPDQARLGRPDLARQRPDHLAVLRVALVGVLPPGHRHRRPRRHADPRRRGRQGRADAVRRRLRRLRQLHLHPARRRAVDVLRAPVALRHLAWARRSARAR